MSAVSERSIMQGDEQARHRLALLALSALVVLAYIPTGIDLNKGPWQTEQEGHGPFILAAAAFIAWSLRERLKATALRPAPLLGWPILLVGLALMVVARSQEILAIEVGAMMPILIGTTLLAGGWPALRLFAFPIALIFFAVPPPGWALDALTLPLKVMISNVVSHVLFAFGYPIAQNGVVIVIGTYQLLVKDACSGMNSIFALSSIGFIYVYIRGHAATWRNVLLLGSILPITICANFIRVVVLVLTAYHSGPQAVEGILHDVTGFALFAVAFALMIGLDGFVDTLMLLRNKSRRTVAESGSAT